MGVNRFRTDIRVSEPGSTRQGDRTANRQGRTTQMARYEYKVVELREGMMGGKMSGDKLERTLNEQAREGWQLRAITATEVKGRIGPGGVEGVLVTFERAVG
jgi:hypothetical protein